MGALRFHLLHDGEDLEANRGTPRTSRLFLLCEAWSRDLWKRRSQRSLRFQTPLFSDFFHL